MTGQKLPKRITRHHFGQVETVSDFTGKCTGREERKCAILVLNSRKGRAIENCKQESIGNQPYSVCVKEFHFVESKKGTDDFCLIGLSTTAPFWWQISKGSGRSSLEE